MSRAKYFLGEWIDYNSFVGNRKETRCGRGICDKKPPSDRVRRMKTVHFRRSLALLATVSFVLSLVVARVPAAARWPTASRGRNAMVASQHELASKIGL